jgi:hypothetical protein
VTIAIKRGGPVDGWLRVDNGHLRTKRQLARWVSLGTNFARSLPPKHPKPNHRSR